MNFLKKLFSGPADGSASDGSLFLYVRPKMCKEILRVRVDTKNGPSAREDGDGYYMRKVASGARCPFQVEIELFFDASKRLQDKQIVNGEFVTEDDYNALYTQTGA